MSDLFSLRIEDRPNIGKGASRAIRRRGMVPAVLYGMKQDNSYFAVDIRDINKALDQKGFYTHLFDMTIDGKAENFVCKEVQFHPVSDDPIHIDFMRVGKDTKFNVRVPLSFINRNKSPGLKQGGILNVVHHNLDIICTRDNIPESIDMDLTGLEIGATLRVQDITLPDGVVIAKPKKYNTMANIAAPKGS